jgi:hypothetical protein
MQLSSATQLAETENEMPPGEGARLMSVEAQAALVVDPSLVDAHAVLAMAAVLDREWEQADHEFELVHRR